MTEATALSRYETIVMESQRLLTAALGLTVLPERLDDETLAKVQDLASSRLPELPNCPEPHFNKCMRVMLAVLPKRVSDDVSGELFVAAYQRQLGHYPQDAISFLADAATSRCRWFPTIAECLEMVAEWVRNDDAVKLKRAAGDAARREKRLRSDETRPRIESQPLTQDDVDQMDEMLIRIGIGGGWIKRDDGGRPVLVDVDEETRKAKHRAEFPIAGEAA